MCYKADATYPTAKQFAPEYSKSQEVCSKFAATCPFVFDSVPD